MPTENMDRATVIVIARDGMGDAPKELRDKLLRSYLTLLAQNGMLPRVICFYASGVHLVVEDSPVLAELQGLEALGVRLVACSTCIDYYGLAERVRVGVVGGMGDILEAQWTADHVLAL
jgi:intracellular sulfur oxidation DsrE/DsrF family protein